MKKIKLSKKLSLNKVSIISLNEMELKNAKGGDIALPGTFDLLCGYSGGCVCTTSKVETCGYYCPPVLYK